MSKWVEDHSPRFEAIAIAVLGLLVGAYHLGTRSILLDESTSVEIARVSIGSLPGVLMNGDPNMRLFYVLLSPWIKIFGESEAAVRSLPLIFGALAAGAVCLLGARLFGRQAGVLAGTLLAVNAFLVQYEQTARSYTLLVLLVSASSLLLAMEHDRPSRRLRAAYALVVVLAVYAHFFAALVVMAHITVVLVLRRREYLTVSWAWTSGAIAILCIPAVLAAIHAGPQRIDWIEQPSPRDIVKALEDLAGNSLPTLLSLLLCAAFTVVQAVRRGNSAIVVFLLTWLMLPIVTAYMISFVQPVFESNYLIICLPPFVLLAGASVEFFRSRSIALVVAASLVTLSALQVAKFYALPTGQDWRGASFHVLRSARADDAIVFFPSYARKPYDYYSRHYAGAVTPIPQSTHVENARRTWLVIRESDAAIQPGSVTQVRSLLKERLRLDQVRSFRYVTVELYVR